jgi:hypothetical protein
MRRVWLVVCTIALGSIAAACGKDAPTAPTTSPTPDREGQPFTEGTYRLVVTSVGAAQGCEVVVPGRSLGSGSPALGGGFDTVLTLRAESGGWAGRGQRHDESGMIELLLDARDWPRSARLTGTMQGRTDQRAFDGPRVDFSGTSADRPATFEGLVVSRSTDQIATGEARGRFVYESAWTGSVIACSSATVSVKN